MDAIKRRDVRFLWNDIEFGVRLSGCVLGNFVQSWIGMSCAVCIGCIHACQTDKFLFLENFGKSIYFSFGYIVTHNERELFMCCTANMNVTFGG